MLSVSASENMLQTTNFLQQFTDTLEVFFTKQECQFLKLRSELRAKNEEDKINENDRPFSKDKICSTMTREYLSWIGLFTQSKNV